MKEVLIKKFALDGKNYTIMNLYVSIDDLFYCESESDLYIKLPAFGIKVLTFKYGSLEDISIWNNNEEIYCIEGGKIVIDKLGGGIAFE